MHFLVRGRENREYEVVFKRDGDNLTALCTCTGAQRGLHCHHRMKLIYGNDKDVLGDNKHEVPLIESMLIGTDVEAALEELTNAENGNCTDTVKAFRKKLGRALKD